MSETIIKLENLTKKFGNLTAVNNINLEVKKGEVVGLVGPNGAGKTTTIKLIANIIRPNSGSILIKNNKGELQDLIKNSRNLIKRGFLIDIPSFYNMTPKQLLNYFANLQNYPKEKKEKRIDDLLELFKLSEWKNKNVKIFSKGMTQKLGMIQAIIHDPEIIVLDEPQTGLDPKARIDVRQVIKELKNQGKTIFLASHMLFEISEICDKIALLNRGSIIAFDSIKNLERTLKTSEIDCELLEPIPLERYQAVRNQIIEKLNPFLKEDLDPSISTLPVVYNPDDPSLRLFYDGKRESIGNILKILVKEFESDFTIISYTKSKTSQLERIYSEKIAEDDDKITGGDKR